MYELIKVADNSYYIDCPAKIGIFRGEDDKVYAVDSGNDKEAGKKVRKILDEKGWKLSAIYNTHSNADHIGGNKYLQGQTGCRIYAPGIDCDFTRHTLLEPSFLYGGFPPKELRHKFLMAQESRAEYLTDDVLPEGVSSIPLPGHFFDMVGYRNAEDVVYLADCLASREILDKYQIWVMYDVAAGLETLEKVKKMQGKVFVPAHAEASEDIAPLAQYNINKIWEIAESILTACAKPCNADEVLRQLFSKYGLQMNFEQYVLIGSTVRSYLVWLRELGRLDAAFEDNRLLWERV